MQDQTSRASEYVDNFLNQVIEGLPRFIGALAILIIGYFVARALAGVTVKALRGINLDARLHSGKGGNVIQRAVPSPTNLAAKLAYWVSFLFAASLAISVLGIQVLVDFVRAVYAYIPNIIAAILIFLVASAISAAVAGLVNNTMGDTPSGKVAAAAGPMVVMGLAVFMILNQLKIAPEIVTLTYAAIVGSASLGMALAFGLGGRDVAGQILQGLYEKGKRNKGLVANDFRKGTSRAKQQADL